MPTIYRDKDASLEAFHGKRVGMLGYGSQGRAQALNLRDSGIDVRIGVRSNGPSASAADGDGFVVEPIESVATDADFLVFALPDVAMGKVYREVVVPCVREGQTFVFAHGFAIQYGLVLPPEGVDIILVAPMGAGPIVRRRFEQRSGVPGLLAVERDASGAAWERVKAYGSAIGCGRVAMLATTFREETESDLFGEQAVLCGGLPELIRASFDTAVRGGIAPEIAYIACLHEVKLIADLMYERGLDGMVQSISATAEWGGYEAGPAVIGMESRAALERLMSRITSGQFAKEWIAEAESGSAKLLHRRKRYLEHPIQEAGRKVREFLGG